MIPRIGARRSTRCSADISKSRAWPANCRGACQQRFLDVDLPMSERILLPVTYLGQELELPLSVVPWGYNYQLHIEISDRILIFEKDENREYRVIDNSGITKPVAQGFVEAIIDSLNAIQSGG